MAVASYLEGVKAGAGAIDCAIASMAGFSSQPPVESMLGIFRETEYQVDLDMKPCERSTNILPTLPPPAQKAGDLNPLSTLKY
jgi:pyruvate/oxaloacetate carboxyltransferase